MTAQKWTMALQRVLVAPQTDQKTNRKRPLKGTGGNEESESVRRLSAECRF